MCTFLALARETTPDNVTVAPSDRQDAAAPGGALAAINAKHIKQRASHVIGRQLLGAAKLAMPCCEIYREGRELAVKGR
ncbi:MAG: hypothetical protein KGI68_06790 [Alphaproteobacteria bacterium]|nr:hypothetical protein [Alphaproteobacteria bacterium]MDE2265159.1 hypothetical protein [Alphaproteobacteria bacterium]